MMRHFWLAFITLAVTVCSAQQRDDLANAVKQGRTFEVRDLIARGVNLNKGDYSASTCGNWYLPEATLLMVGVSCDQYEIVDILISSGAKLNHLTNDDYTCLALAVSNRNLRMLNLLLNRGATLNAAYQALMLASEQGYNEIIGALLDRGMYVNYEDAHYRTPLLYAAKTGQTDTCRYLLEKGADIDRVTNYGMTPLAWAAYNNHLETYRFLLGRGASKKFCVYPMCNTN